MPPSRYPGVRSGTPPLPLHVQTAPPGWSPSYRETGSHRELPLTSASPSTLSPLRAGCVISQAPSDISEGRPGPQKAGCPLTGPVPACAPDTGGHGAPACPSPVPWGRRLLETRTASAGHPRAERLDWTPLPSPGLQVGPQPAPPLFYLVCVGSKGGFKNIKNSQALCFPISYPVLKI